MDLIGHLVAGDELPARRVSGDHDGLEVGEDALVGEFAEQFVGEIVGGQLLVADGDPARAPAIATAGPVDLLLGQLIVAPAGFGGEPGRDHDGVLERSSQEGRRQPRPEVIVGVAAGAMNQDECAPNLSFFSVSEYVRYTIDRAGPWRKAIHSVHSLVETHAAP